MKKREFKVGDSVRVIIENELHEFKSGDVVEVTRKIDVEEFVNGQEVEVRDHDMHEWKRRNFLAMHSNGRFVTEVGQGVSSWAYCRAIQQTPEYTMEQAIELVGHEFKIKQ